MRSDAAFAGCHGAGCHGLPGRVSVTDALRTAKMAVAPNVPGATAFQAVGA